MSQHPPLLTPEEFLQTSVRRDRIRLAGPSLACFAHLYLQHHLRLAPASFHYEIMDELSGRVLRTATGPPFRYAAAVPQSYGKSFIGTLVLPLWCFAFGHARHIALLCASRAFAAERMRLVLYELEHNQLLRHDFPHLRKIHLRSGSGVSRPCDLTIAGGLRLIGMYRNSHVAALSHEGKSPDLIIADDIDAMNKPNEAPLRSTRAWWDRTIEPELSHAASLVVLGTPRQRNDLIQELFDATIGEGWSRKMYSAITRYPKEDILITFEHICRGVYEYQGQTGLQAAKAWLHDASPEALEGGAVSWPAKERLLDLILLKAKVGWWRFDVIRQCWLETPVDLPFFTRKGNTIHRRPFLHVWLDDAQLIRGSDTSDVRKAVLFNINKLGPVVMSVKQWEEVVGQPFTEGVDDVPT